MNYEDKIEALKEQINDADDKILRLMEEQHSLNHINDISAGDMVIFKATDILATVEESKFVASNFHGDRSVYHILVCKTRSGKTHTKHRYEVEKL